VAPSDDRLRFAEPAYVAGKGEQSALLVGKIPIEPGDRRILAIYVVVSVLGLTKFVAGEKHGDTLGEEQGLRENCAAAGRARH
jgi:hypothetical protein